MAEIVRLRHALAPDNGGDFIRDELAEIAAVAGWAERGWRVPARATINRVLDRHGLLEPSPRKRTEPPGRAIRAERPAAR